MKFISILLNKCLPLLLLLSLLLCAVPDTRAETFVSRAQFAMLINNALNMTGGIDDNFKDVSPSHPYAKELSAAKANAYYAGDLYGNVLPDSPITDLQAAAVFSNILVNKYGWDISKVPLIEDSSLPSWAVHPVSLLYDLNINTSISNTPLTELEAAEILHSISVALMLPPDSPYGITQADIEDDFYGYTNRKFLATAKIKPGELSVSTISEANTALQNKISEIILDIVNKAPFLETGSDEWKIAELYKMYISSAISNNGIKELEPYLTEIRNLKSISELLEYEKKHNYNFPYLFNIELGSDAVTDRNKWCVFLVPASLGLGSTTYYEDTPNLEEVQQAYCEYIAKLLAYAGETRNLEARAEAIFNMEKELARRIPENIYDTVAIYTPASWEDMYERTAKTQALEWMFSSIDTPMTVYCACPEYIRYADNLYSEENLAVMKDFSIINLLNTMSDTLGEEFYQNSAKLRKILYGQPEGSKTLQQRAVDYTAKLTSEVISTKYIEKHFSISTKKEIENLSEEIRGTFRQRIESLDWMSLATKEKAIEKLNSVRIYVGYADEKPDIPVITVKPMSEGGTLLDVQLNLLDVYDKYTKELLKKPYPDNPWQSVPAATINAFYNRYLNAIIVPAGILQGVFYHPNAPREKNLGAIGTIIAHEFTHAFDKNGALFDKNGNINNWWSDSDAEAFEKLTESVASALSGIEFMPGAVVDGGLCTDEAIADLGGMACVIDIAQNEPETDIGEIMRSWSYVWAARIPPELAAYLMRLDSHLPNKLRANFTLSQFDLFYQLFDITENDGMYIAPEKRLTIW